MNRHIKRVKYMTLLLALCIPLVMLYYMLYIGTHEEHHCTGRACPICHQIHMAESVIKQFQNLSPCVILTILSIYLVCEINKENNISVRRRTPVLDRVRMDD